MPLAWRRCRSPGADAARLAPTPRAGPSILAASSRANIATAKSVSEARAQHGGYVEVQIHGGLSLDDLVEIIYL
jgi:hypothetical protein